MSDNPMRNKTDLEMLYEADILRLDTRIRTLESSNHRMRDALESILRIETRDGSAPLAFRIAQKALEVEK